MSPHTEALGGGGLSANASPPPRAGPVSTGGGAAMKTLLGTSPVKLEAKEGWGLLFPGVPQPGVSNLSNPASRPFNKPHGLASLWLPESTPMPQAQARSGGLFSKSGPHTFFLLLRCGKAVPLGSLGKSISSGSLGSPPVLHESDAGSPASPAVPPVTWRATCSESFD